MSDLLTHPAVQTVLAIAVLMVAVYCAIQILIRLRPSTCKADTNAGELARNFEEMRLEGDIDDTELRKIKAVLGKSQETRTGS